MLVVSAVAWERQRVGGAERHIGVIIRRTSVDHLRLNSLRSARLLRLRVLLSFGLELSHQVLDTCCTRFATQISSRATT